MSEEQKLIGIIDEPIKPYEKSATNDQSDRLGVDDYANALGEFIKKTQTPMTVGIQGEWGSGKTSLLNSLMNLLEGKAKNTSYECIWINTWEHSLLKSPEEALISIVTEISNTVTQLNGDSKVAGQIAASGKKLLSGAVRVAAGMTMGLAGSEVTKELLESKADNSIKKLREDLELFIKKIVEDEKSKDINKIKKLVFFIDDLDRIEPKDAVKVLELLKNIFSIEHCVFVLAIDYQVIIKGLKDKFGEKNDENEREFRSFFDKIIQLPFTMPTSKYSVADYVIGLLKDISFIEKKNEFNQEIVNEILVNTIGSNPRSIKRLINNLSLLNILADIKNKQKNLPQANQDEKMLEFALVCCQVAYPKIYELINVQPEINEWDEEFAFGITQKKEELDPNFNSLFEKASDSEDFNDDWEKSLFRITYIYYDLRKAASKISRFLSLITKDNKKNSNIKIEYENDQLIKILNDTSATVVTSNDDNKFIKPEKYQTLETLDDFEKSLKISGEAKINQKIIENRLNNLNEIIDIFEESLKLDGSKYERKLYGRHITFRTIKGNSFSNFCIFYPLSFQKNHENKYTINLWKDPNQQFKLPKSSGFETEHVANFNRSGAFWKYSYRYHLRFTIEELRSNKTKILELFLRSSEIIANNEEQLKEVRFEKLNETQLNDLEKKSLSDYSFDV